MSKKLKFVKNEMYEYEVFDLVDTYDPVLKNKLEPYVFGDTKESRYITVSLLETMVRNHGVGLAANQCGLKHRVFVIGGEGYGCAFFNPVIEEEIGEYLFPEGCLSALGLYLPIKRAAEVKVSYQDMYGEPKTQHFTGLSARTVLHEFDHMEGIVFTSKVSPIILEREKRKVKTNIKKLKRQYEEEEKMKLIAQATQKVIYEENKKITGEETHKDFIRINS